MIRRSTVVYIIALLAVVSLYFGLRTRENSATATTTATPTATEEISYVFTADEGSPTQILVQAKSGEAVELARNSENAWVLKQPIEAAAVQGDSEAAASQVSTLRILEKAPKIDPSVVGLKQPEYVLTVKFNSGTERTVRIGVVTPTESGYYIQEAGNEEVLIVTKSSVDALLRLLTTPPYSETPTPNPETSTGSPTTSPTP